MNLAEQTEPGSRRESGISRAAGYSVAYVYFAAFWAGAFVMTLEILGGRTLAPYFGSGVHVWGSVIFVFMLSLSIGYLAGGRLSRRNPQISRLALLLVAAGVATLPGMLVGEGALASLEASGLDPRYAAVIGSIVLFLLPTTLWGMVSPYAVRLLVRTADHSGESAGRLYFVSTAGSSVGTLLTSFYLVLWFDIDTIVLSVVAGSIAVGLIGLAARTGNAEMSA